MTQFGDVKIVDGREQSTAQDVPKLSPSQIKQLEYLMKEYPMLDQMALETVLRLSDEQRDKIVDEIKNAELEPHSKPEDPENCKIEAVEVSG